MKKVVYIPLFKQLCLAFLGLIAQFSSGAQCSSSLLQSVTYDTLVHGSGNDSYAFSFPKFDPSLGTLVAAKINSVVSVNYGFVLRNVESVRRNFSISVGRIDDFTSDAFSGDFSNQLQVNIGTFSLNPGNSVSQSLTPIISQTLITDSITSNLANFLGAGTVNFDYEPTTYTTLLGSVNYYYSASANDTVHFSVSYLYCNAALLPLNMLHFEAARENATTVQLSWVMENELPGRNYEIQKSADGKVFTPVTVIPSQTTNNINASYLYHYTLAIEDKNRIYFRIKETDGQGEIKYSEIRAVNLNEAGVNGLGIFPNPASSFINVFFNQPSPKNWQVDILAANGALLQRNVYFNRNSVHLDFKSRPAAGVYFVRATDMQAQKNYIQTFVVE